MRKILIFAIAAILIALPLPIVVGTSEPSCNPGCDLVDTCNDGCWSCKCSDGTGKSHNLKIDSIDDTFIRLNHDKKINVSVNNKGDYDEENISVFLDKCPYGWKCSDAEIGIIYIDEQATVELTISAPNESLLSSLALAARAENRKAHDSEYFNAVIWQECGNNADCPEGQYCSNNRCICEERWVCGKLSDCTNGKQAMDCVDANGCGTTDEKPKTEIDCEVNPENNDINDSSNSTGSGPLSGITGQATGGYQGSGGFNTTTLFLGGIGGLGFLGILYWLFFVN